MTPAFRTAVEIVLAQEGGYSNDKNDPGGETRWGISKKNHPELNIKDLTREQAKIIYFNDYWNKIRGDRLPLGIAVAVFDMAVNMGVSRAIKTLQRAIGVKADGVIGDQTIAAVGSHAKAYILERMTHERIMAYTALPTFKIYGNGWISRAIEILSTGILIRDEI